MNKARVDRQVSWRRLLATVAMATHVAAGGMTPTSGSALSDIPPAISSAQEPQVSPADNDREPYQAKRQFPVPPPPFSSEDIFPCSSCHEDLEVNTQKRKLTEFHEEIKLVHGTRERWCFDCHSPENRDMLRLAGGELVPFTESYRLCGQCHGDKYRDWKVGVHGKRMGEWNGKKQYLLCAHCHNPHTPHFAPIHPMPPPVRPSSVH